MDGNQTRSQPRSMADLEALFKQAGAGEPEAMRQVAALTAIGLGTPPDWPKALKWLAAADRAGSAAAREELALLGDKPEAALEAPAPKYVSNLPLIARAEGIASAALCDWLIKRAGPLLEPLEVYELPKEMLEQGLRSNTGAALPLLAFGLPLIALRTRLSNLVGLSVEGFETANVLHYNVGEVFSPHYDTFFPEQMRTEKDAAQFGHRVFTALVYLNTDYDGGETDFPTARWRHRGGKGDALFWRNVTSDMELDRNTLHAGLSPLKGQKWVLSQWIRAKPMPLTL